MVKLNWLEELAIYIIVAVITIFFVRFGQTLIGYDSYSLWVWVIAWLILYVGISGIIIKIIKGKDKEESKQNKEFEKWWKELKKSWKKQKTYEKVLLILVFILIVFGILMSLFG